MNFVPRNLRVKFHPSLKKRLEVSRVKIITIPKLFVTIEANERSQSLYRSWRSVTKIARAAESIKSTVNAKWYIIYFFYCCRWVPRRDPNPNHHRCRRRRRRCRRRRRRRRRRRLRLTRDYTSPFPSETRRVSTKRS